MIGMDGWMVDGGVSALPPAVHCVGGFRAAVVWRLREPRLLVSEAQVSYGNSRVVICEFRSLIDVRSGILKV